MYLEPINLSKWMVAARFLTVSGEVKLSHGKDCGDPRGRGSELETHGELHTDTDSYIQN